ncbi:MULTISPECIES: hypothetical protein [Microbispora]|uniref:DUF3040 domain-containing protein n=1 Tax=Microbispora triticiradicis TaxID=2200763 RepID=A0ABX9LS10_9ACTN|nr:MULTISPECIES: hypothetical protein [Microbispora]MBO4272630.1 hypothetical protein [Microbispora triticiradicis]RGA06784.1 hypothetical protein DI270_001400 [Microbispora triticiradicis]RGA06819.1 hypothetical protein DI270_001310 [Microbispora triticiradicis]GLW22359.1 hypothetical protein Mame01_24020 [Microbispora amethystogenes]
MSKERARRRAEREAERERLAAARAEREARAARRRELRDRLVGPIRTAVLPRPARPVRVARQRGYLARRRRTENGVAVTLWFLVQALAWILFESWMARLGVFLGSILLLPVLVTIVFDRRS